MDLYEGQNKEKALLDNMAELLAKEKQLMELKLIAKERQLEDLRGRYDAMRREGHQGLDYNQAIGGSEGLGSKYSEGRGEGRVMTVPNRYMPEITELPLKSSISNTVVLDLTGQELTLINLKQIIKQLTILPRLTTMVLRDCGIIDDAYEMIGEILSGAYKISNFDVSKNLLKDMSSRILIHEISHNPTLTSLDISDNPFSKAANFSSLVSAAAAKSSSIVHLSFTPSPSTAAAVGAASNDDGAKAKAKSKIKAAPVVGSRDSAGSNYLTTLTSNHSIKSLGIIGSNLTVENLLLLNNSLVSLTSLDLSYSFIGTKGAVALANMLSGTVTTTTAAAKKAAPKAVAKPKPGTKKKGESKPATVHDTASVAPVTKRKITLISLNLKYSGITCIGGIELLKSLQTFNTLTDLNLCGNDLRDDFLQELALFLQTESRPLIKCDIGRNDFTEDGIASLLRTIKNNTSLLSLGESIMASIPVGSQRAIRNRLQTNTKNSVDGIAGLSLLSSQLIIHSRKGDEVCISSNGLQDVVMFHAELPLSCPDNVRICARWKSMIDPGKYNFIWTVKRKCRGSDEEKEILSGKFSEGLDKGEEPRAFTYRNFVTSSLNWNGGDHILICMRPYTYSVEETSSTFKAKSATTQLWISDVDIYLDERPDFGVILSDPTELTVPVLLALNEYVEHRKVYIQKDITGLLNVQFRAMIQKPLDRDTSIDDSFSWRIVRRRSGVFTSDVSSGMYFEGLVEGEVPHSTEMRRFSIDVSDWCEGDVLLLYLRYMGKSRDVALTTSTFTLRQVSHTMGQGVLNSNSQILFASATPFSYSDSFSAGDNLTSSLPGTVRWAS